jgi:hypothetical protein
MKPLKYIYIDLRIALEEQQDGRVNAIIVEPLPTINLDTGARISADQQGTEHHAHREETVIRLDE